MKEYIVFSGKEHYNSLGIVRTLGEAGIRPVYVAVKSDPKFVGQSRYVKRRHYVDSVEDGVRLIQEVYGTDKTQKSFIFVEDDWTVAALDAHYEELKDFFYFFNAGGQLKPYLNKDRLNALAESYGLNVPRTWKVTRGEIPADIVYPVMTKAINSIGTEWKDIVFVCADEQQLKQAYEKITSETILLQEYIHKVDEASFDAFSINHGAESFIVMEAYQMYCIPDKYSPYWRIENPRRTDIAEKIKAMIRHIGFEGVFEFEFMVDGNGKFWFLEINFRNTALGFATTVAGMPQVVLWAEAMERGRIDESRRVQIPSGMKAIAECFDYDVRVRGGVVSHHQWMKEYRAIPCKMYKGRHDNIPFYRFMWYKLTKMRRGNK